MKKAASAFLRMEICHADITRMIRWMRNPNVTKYLNEAPDVAQSLEQLVRSVPEPMYQYHLCRTGHFFMVCHQENESVGFVKLLPQNLRSIRCVPACGFQQMAEMPRLVRFEITFDAYCRSLQEKRA